MDFFTADGGGFWSTFRVGVLIPRASWYFSPFMAHAGTRTLDLSAEALLLRSFGESSAPDAGLAIAEDAAEDAAEGGTGDAGADAGGEMLLGTLMLRWMPLTRSRGDFFGPMLLAPAPALAPTGLAPEAGDTGCACFAAGVARADADADADADTGVVLSDGRLPRACAFGDDGSSFSIPRDRQRQRQCVCVMGYRNV